MNIECDPRQPIRIRVDAEIAALVPGFLENRRKDVTLVLQAVDQGDFETARVLGHSMKGSGGGYGFDAITDILKDPNKIFPGQKLKIPPLA